MAVPPAAMSISHAVERRCGSRSGCPDTVIRSHTRDPGAADEAAVAGPSRALAGGWLASGGHRRVERAA